MAEYQKLSSKSSIDHEDGGLLGFVEEKRQQNLKQGQPWAARTEEEYIRAFRNQFDAEKAIRDQFYFNRLREDHNHGKFPAYVDETKRRLSRHGFTRTFGFNEDPKRQDKLTTWIEYLNFECSWSDKHTHAIESLQSRRDDAWKTLADSGMLRPGETAEFLPSVESANQRPNEIDQNAVALKSAEALAEAALNETAKAKVDPGRSLFTKEERMRRLAAADSRLAAAQAAFKSAKKRNDRILDFLQQTRIYREHKMSVREHGFLLKWIREQIPLLEAESDDPKVALGSAHAGRAESGCDRDDETAVNGRGPITRERRRGRLSSLLDSTNPLVQAKQPPKPARSDDATVPPWSSNQVRNNPQDLNSRGRTSATEPKGSHLLDLTMSWVEIGTWLTPQHRMVTGLRERPNRPTTMQIPVFLESLQASSELT